MGEAGAEGFGVDHLCDEELRFLHVPDQVCQGWYYLVLQTKDGVQAAACGCNRLMALMNDLPPSGDAGDIASTAEVADGMQSRMRLHFTEQWQKTNMSERPQN